MKLWLLSLNINVITVVPYIGTWIETTVSACQNTLCLVVPYIGTWIETMAKLKLYFGKDVVPYIGTWIETKSKLNFKAFVFTSYLI